MPDLETLFSELDELRPSDELDRRVAGLTAARQPHSSLRRRSRRAALVFGTAAAVVLILIGFAIAAHSRSSNGPAKPAPRRQPLTPANLLGAIQAHGFNEISVLPNKRATCQLVRGNSVQYGYQSTLKVNPSGFPKTQVRTGGLFQVMPSAAIAKACVHEIIDETMHPIAPPNTNKLTVWRRLSTSIYEDPFCGPSCGELPILTHGDVRRDGSYSIIAARGRILLLGIASDRPDAFAVERTMKSVAAGLTG